MPIAAGLDARLLAFDFHRPQLTRPQGHGVPRHRVLLSLMCKSKNELQILPDDLPMPTVRVWSAS